MTPRPPRRLIGRWMHVPTAHLVHHFQDLRVLSPLRRLATPKGRRHACGLTLGVGFMFVGSSLAMYQWLPCHHIICDVTGYFLHAFGAFPVLEHARPLWVLLAEID